MALAVLSPVVRRGLLAVPAKAVIDSIRRAVHRIHHVIRRNICPGIKIRRAIIVQIDITREVPIMMMVVMKVHVGRK